MLSSAPLVQALLLLVGYMLFVGWSLRSARTPARNRADTIIAYASEGGRGAKLALQLQRQLQQQYKACRSEKTLALVHLNQLTPALLAQAQQLLVIASTYGEGEAPDNGRLFLARLQNGSHLNHLQFAVLALGDSHYEYFCAFGVQVHAALLQQQARALFPVIQVDKVDQRSLEQWQNQLMCHAIIDCVQDTHHDLVPESASTITLQRRQLLNYGSPGQGIYQLDFNPQGVPPWRAGDIVKLLLNGQEREYTIASLPEEKTLRLLVREQFSAQGQAGLGSGFLCQQLPIGATAEIVVHSNVAFHSPDPATPLILIGNGTGLAGLRAHLKQREQQGSHQNWLIYGERSPDYDRPWCAELEGWHMAGHLQQLDLTFSRTDDDLDDTTVATPCRVHTGYVQHALVHQQQRLRHWLESGAVVYLCGSKAGMATDVERQLVNLLGAEQVDILIEQGRFKRDVY